MSEAQQFAAQPRTHTFPAEVVTVTTQSGVPREFKCPKLEVPLDSNGEPLLSRVQVDAHGNLRLTVTPFETHLIARDNWGWVTITAPRLGLQ